MYATAIILAAAAGFVAAQTTTSSAAASAGSSGAVSGCGAQVDTIIQTCLGTENAQLAACSAQDWDCLCEQSKNVLTCYNNCPGDPNAFGAQQTSISYCNAAKAYGTSTSSTLKTSMTATSSAAMSDATSASKTTTATVSGTSGGAQASGTSKTGNAVTTASPSGAATANGVAPLGVLAAIFGLVALF